MTKSNGFKEKSIKHTSYVSNASNDKSFIEYYIYIYIHVHYNIIRRDTIVYKVSSYREQNLFLRILMIYHFTHRHTCSIKHRLHISALTMPCTKTHTTIYQCL